MAILNKTIFVFYALAAAGLIACGGEGGGSSGVGGGSTTGQAAVGAPMSYASITIKSLVDSTSQTTAGDESGNFTVTSGVTYPALVSATSANGAYTYYGYMKSAKSTPAVNPLTTTLLALSTGQAPSTITTPLTDNQIEAGKAAISSIFGRVLTAANVSASSISDLLNTKFTTDHTGLDLVLDSVSVETLSDGTVSLTNKLSGIKKGASQSDTSELTFDTDDSNDIANLPIASCSTFLSGLNSTNLASDNTVYDPNFLNAGLARDDFKSFVSTAVNRYASFKFAMPTFTGTDGNGNLSFNVMLVNTTTNKYVADLLMTLKKNTSGNCVMVGDQYPFSMTIQPAIKKMIRADEYAKTGVLATDVGNHVVDPAINGIEIMIGATDNSNNVNTTTGKPGGSQINSVRVDICNKAEACRNLATMSSQNKPNNKGNFRIDGSDYNFINMMPTPAGNFSLYSDSKNPIKVTFFSSATAPRLVTDNTNKVGNSLYAKSLGEVFSANEFANITLPSSTNASTVLTAFNDLPAVQYDSGTGNLMGVLVLTSNGTSIKSTQMMLLKKGSGSATAEVSSDYSDARYRSIELNSRIPSRAGNISTKYLWSPGSRGSY